MHKYKILTWVIFVFFLIIVGCEYNNEEGLYNDTPDSIAAEEILHIPFDGDFNNVKDNQNKILFGLVDSLEWPKLNFDRNSNKESACLFNGTNNFFIAYSGLLDSVAISLWIQPLYEIYYTNYQTVIEDNRKAINLEIDAVSGATGEYNMTYTINGQDSIETDHYEFDVWHHVYLDAGSEVISPRLYIDGELVGSLVDTPKLENMGELLYFARQAYGNDVDNSFYKGRIDELRIYNYLLTEKEIKALYLSK